MIGSRPLATHSMTSPSTYLTAMLIQKCSSHETIPGFTSCTDGNVCFYGSSCLETVLVNSNMPSHTNLLVSTEFVLWWKRCTSTVPKSLSNVNFSSKCKSNVFGCSGKAAKQAQLPVISRLGQQNPIEGLPKIKLAGRYKRIRITNEAPASTSTTELDLFVALINYKEACKVKHSSENNTLCHMPMITELDKKF